MPELKYFDNEYVFEPWKAPLDLQESASCIIGRDYPEPILDHYEVFNDNVAKLKQFFESLNFQKTCVTSEAYKDYTFQKFLEDEFDDF